MAGYNCRSVRQEGDLVNASCLYYSGVQKPQQLLEGPVVGRSWFSSAEGGPYLVKTTADKRRMIGGSSSCRGADSPVSVILAASKHLMQVSHPSSASVSMEHPVDSSCASPPQLLHQCVAPAATHQSQAFGAAGSMSERVQQAFSKPLEVTPTKVYESNDHTSETSSVLQSSERKPWPYYTQKSVEWLNLQEAISSLKNNSARPTLSVQNHTFPSSPEDDDDASACCAHAQTFPVYSGSSREDRDEESVIDFFPSSNRPSSAMQLRRRSYERAAVKEAILLAAETRKVRGGQPAAEVAGAEGDRRPEEAEESTSKSMRGGRVASGSSSKWEDAQRWLTCRGPLLPHFDMLLKAGTPQLVQDKHVPETLNSRVREESSHALRKEAGSKVASKEMRDMATQSTPADSSRCNSPTSERPNFGAGAEKLSVATAANKPSPPRHNTPARRSISCSRQSEAKQLLGGAPPPHLTNGKLNLLELESCHLDKLKLAREMPVGTSGTWQLLADEDMDCSVKLLDRKATPLHELAKQHQQAKVNMVEARVSAWEDVERAKHSAKFKREEAKIEAWENLQHAEAEAELHKLEVKLEKLRFEAREKIMGKLGAAQRRAQEMRHAAEAHHTEQLARVGMRANHIRKSGHLPSSTYNIVCSLTSKIKPTSNLSFP